MVGTLCPLRAACSTVRDYLCVGYAEPSIARRELEGKEPSSANEVLKKLRKSRADLRDNIADIVERSGGLPIEARGCIEWTR